MKSEKFAAAWGDIHFISLTLQQTFILSMERRQHNYTEQEAYLKLSAQCAMSEQCCHDMMKKMRNWQMDTEVAEKVVARLVKEGFINEERYARAFVRDKFLYNHWGKVRIEHELKMRHIAPKHIEAGLEEIEEEDNLEALRRLIEKKRPSVKGKSDYEIKGKLIRFALSRGFEMDDILEVVEGLEFGV